MKYFRVKNSIVLLCMLQNCGATQRPEWRATNLLAQSLEKHKVFSLLGSLYELLKAKSSTKQIFANAAELQELNSPNKALMLHELNSMLPHERNFNTKQDENLTGDNSIELKPSTRSRYSPFSAGGQQQAMFQQPTTFNILDQLQLQQLGLQQMRPGKKKPHHKINTKIGSTKSDQSQRKPTNQQRKQKRRKKKKKKKPPASLGTPAQVIHVKPHYISRPTTTTPAPFHKIKYALRKAAAFKLKKKEYLNHLQHVAYPFIKFIVFFTVLNPFTLGVFLFSLISPVVFGFLGFVGLSFLVKPALHLLFDVKRRVNLINRKKWLALREQREREERLRQRRPISIHKHYYGQGPPPTSLPTSLPTRYRKQKHGRIRHNPLLPQLQEPLKFESPW